MTDESQVERARAKLQLEIGNCITGLRELGERSALLELCALGFMLHLSRVRSANPEWTPEVRPEFLRLLMSLTEDSLKYAIQLCVKFGTGGFLEAKGIPVYQRRLTQEMVDRGIELNSKYEALSLLELFDVEVSGPRDRYLSIDMRSVLTDPVVRKMQDYFVRIDHDASLLKGKGRQKDAFLADAASRLAPYDDLFQEEFKVSVGEYLALMDDLVTRTGEVLAKHERKIRKLENGNLDMTDPVALLAFALASRVRRSNLAKRHGSNLERLIDRLTFDPKLFDEKELRFNAVARRPLLPMGREEFLVFPELVLDSVFVNTHYSLLEGSVRVQGAYKERKAERFLDELAGVGKMAGYVERSRNVYLREGKVDLGDLDLVLVNSSNQFLLIEAKDHALPLDVYFKDVIKTNDHLVAQKKNWETKVLKRLAHVRQAPEKYGISGPFQYVLVSRYPEVLAHHSELMVLSRSEFEVWLSLPPGSTFQDLYKHLYEAQTFLAPDEMGVLAESGVFFARISKESPGTDGQ